MFSGKSEELIRRVRRAIIARRKVQVFKSHLDERYAGIYHISSHDGRTVQAVPIDTPEQIARAVEADTQVVAIDEAQFLDTSVVPLVTALADRGIRVIVAGTDTDFRGEPFGAMPQLLAVAEVVDKLHAICVQCGNPASRNQRLIGGRPARYDSPTIMVGSAETYEARCRACHSVPRRDEEQLVMPAVATMSLSRPPRSASRGRPVEHASSIASTCSGLASSVTLLNISLGADGPSAPAAAVR